jgi:hypothetical protein
MHLHYIAGDLAQSNEALGCARRDSQGVSGLAWESDLARVDGQLHLQSSTQIEYCQKKLQIETLKLSTADLSPGLPPSAADETMSATHIQTVR